MLLNFRISQKYVDEFKKNKCFSAEKLMHLNTRKVKLNTFGLP